MFTPTSFESIAKALQDNVAKFRPAAAAEVFKPVMDQLKAWSDLAQQQAQAAQAAMLEAAQALQGSKEPKAAFEAMQASAQGTMALATKHLQEVTALSVAQFHARVDAFEKAHPAPQAFAAVGKSLKEAASSVEEAMETTGNKGVETVKIAAKKVRTA